MGINIGIIEGRQELDGKTVSYEPQNMELTSFWGGVVNGTMLEIHIGKEHIQLTKKEVNRLKKLLATWQT